MNKKMSYPQIYAKFTKNLSSKVKDIFDRRFGVGKNGGSNENRAVQTETLESIGKSLKITRERVRQIENAGFNFIRKNNKEALDAVLADLNSYLQNSGGFRKEESIFKGLGGAKNNPYILFLLTIGSQFSRICEKKDHYNFWTTEGISGKEVKETLTSLVADIDNHKKLLTKEELSASFAPKYNLGAEALSSYLDISKKIKQNKEGRLGLISWPEIKPKGVKDKAFLVFKACQKPLHFTEITSLIDKLGYGESDKKTHSQTVHNELIKDSRFVLVGRGTYALGEWGYVPGTIKDIITKIIKEKPQNSQEDIVKEVLKQRVVAKNTVMINLGNKKYFTKNSDGRYFVNDVQVA